MLKLHLGCGPVNLPGFVNIDARYQPGVDKIDNIKYLRSYAANSVDLVYVSHVLEHFNRHEYKQVLSRWYEILKPGGILRVAVPDWDKIVEYYLKTKNLRIVSGLLYGGSDYDGNFHHWVWNFEELEKDLKAVGFKDVCRYDSSKTEYAHIHDCSRAMLPHMDYENGTLMSLNVEAQK